MTGADAAAVLSAAAATWPPARVWRHGPFLLRDGRGGGKRVSAASAVAIPDHDDITQAEIVMYEAGETPLFLIGPGRASAALDLLLDRRGYSVIDPVSVLATSLPLRGDVPAGIVTEARWPAPAAARRIWDDAGIGPARCAVMTRAAHPKAVIVARNGRQAVGAAFIAVDQGIAVLHALEVAASTRRQGIGRAIMLSASDWALRQGARQIAVLVTKANAPARALYASLALAPVADYHYRQFQP